MLKAILTLAYAVVFSFSLAANAAENGNMGHKMPGMDQGESMSHHGSMSTGEVKKIDKAAGKITIKHGPLENLGMPGMTMVFRVKEPVALDRVKIGDQIKFEAERVNGALMAGKIEVLK
ncbi:MAG: copper-binding protein [Burkholderiales bacterium]